ncbi:hypothetical protein WCLP8_5420003 [uncultured Gammaproteobacteria bacterium]
MALNLAGDHVQTLSCPTPSGTPELPAAFADEDTGSEAPQARERADGFGFNQGGTEDDLLERWLF